MVGANMMLVTVLIMIAVAAIYLKMEDRKEERQNQQKGL